MAQMALISHVAYLKFKEDEERIEQDREEDRPSQRRSKTPSVPPGGRILNKNDKNNAIAYTLIAGGILGK